MDVVHTEFVDPRPSDVTSTYPGFMSVGVLPSLGAVSAVESLVRCAYRVLHQQSLPLHHLAPVPAPDADVPAPNSTAAGGVHVTLPPDCDLDVVLHTSLGFEPLMIDSRGWKILGRKFASFNPRAPVAAAPVGGDGSGVDQQ